MKVRKVMHWLGKKPSYYVWKEYISAEMSKINFKKFQLTFKDTLIECDNPNNAHHREGLIRKKPYQKNFSNLKYYHNKTI